MNTSDHITTHRLHNFLTGRTSGSWTRESIKSLLANRIVNGEVDGLKLFEAIIAIAEAAYEKGRTDAGGDYAFALLELRRLNFEKVDSMAVERFIERHKAQAGIIEFHGLTSMTTKRETD